MLLGFAVAFFSAGIGIGGGTILVSAFISVFHFDFKRAAGISLATIMPISLIGAISHFVFGTGIPPLGYYMVLIPACILGTILGGRMVRRQQGWRLKFAFACFLLMAAMRMLRVFDLPSLLYTNLPSLSHPYEVLLVMLFGGLIGLTATFLGVGCGLIIVPFCVMVLNLDIHEAIRLSLTTMFFLTLSATLASRKWRTLDTASLRSLLLPALCGAVAGAAVASDLPAPMLTRIFGGALLVVSCVFLGHGLKALTAKLQVSKNPQPQEVPRT